MKNDDKTRIMHLIEHIQRIQVILQGVSEEQFYQSTTLIDAVSYNFAILGEAANRLSSDIQNKHPEIPWGEYHWDEEYIDSRLHEVKTALLVGRNPKRFASTSGKSRDNTEVYGKLRRKE